MADLPVLHTKLNPPRPPRHSLARARLGALLSAAVEHRLTVVQASTGYGKSTALASLGSTGAPLFWYTASDGDRDPQLFLAHIITAFRLGLPSLPEIPFALWQDAFTGATSFERLRMAADALLNALNAGLARPTLLVIDDYHLADSLDVNALTNHLLTFLPSELHVVISTRYPPAWENLVSWRARGEVLDVRRDDLAFTADEIAVLFREVYGIELAPAEVDLIAEKTEGWTIALQLLWQEMRAKPQSDVAALLGPGSESLDTLFAYLARNVLTQQPGEVQEFVLGTSVLRDLDVEACQALGLAGDSHTMLRYLRERDLFLMSLGGGHYRYHHLFHDFLREQAARQDPQAVRERHCSAAKYFRSKQDDAQALYHLLQASDFEQAAQVVEENGENVLRAGRLDTVASWLDAIPTQVIAAHPGLIFLLGDLARLQSRFEEALAWYAQAERGWRAANDLAGISRALRGQALVYLDTVRPSRAQALLEESLRINDGLDDRVARARLLDLLAENKLNMGKAEEAEALRLQARTLREEGPSEDVLSVRVKLRTGRLDEARDILQNWAREERGKPHPPRAHRETLLVLSLIHSMQGHADAALSTAQESLALASQLRSPFVSAVSELRLGHAYQIHGDLAAALRYYEAGVALGDQIAVPRTRAEARWGMTRAHGFSGNLQAARRDAAEGIEIGTNAGDAWIVALAQIALGASLVFARHDREAVGVLGDALAAFRSCADKFGVAAARLWLAAAHWHLNQRERAMAHVQEALAISQEQHYEYLLTTRTLLGWQDERVGVPLLLQARRSGWNAPRAGGRAAYTDPRLSSGKYASYAAQLLAHMGLEQVTTHPGYQLRVQTLGTFRVWRGDVEIAPREWQRRKARELFQLFVTQRGKLLEREQIFELLWHDESPQAAARGFKVALNALNILEPERAADEQPAFIAREDTAYGLRPGADISIDADVFAASIGSAEQSGDMDLLRRALALYQDDYMASDLRYADWAIAERERLQALYLRGAERLASGLLARGGDTNRVETIAWCERVLARDRSWENAYRLLMCAYAQGGDSGQVRRAFEQCQRALREELDVEPSRQTVELFQSLQIG